MHSEKSINSVNDVQHRILSLHLQRLLQLLIIVQSVQIVQLQQQNRHDKRLSLKIKMSLRHNHTLASVL